MKRYLVFPRGYDPVVADGPPSAFYKETLEVFWTDMDTKYHRGLAEKAIETDIKPEPGLWYIDRGNK